MSVTYTIVNRPAVFYANIVPFNWRNMSNEEKFGWVSNFVHRDPNFAHRYIGQRIKNISEYKCVYTFHYVYTHILQKYVDICVNGNEFFEIAIEDVEEPN